jgi:hypothetical protein
MFIPYFSYHYILFTNRALPHIRIAMLLWINKVVQCQCQCPAVCELEGEDCEWEEGRWETGSVLVFPEVGIVPAKPALVYRHNYTDSSDSLGFYFQVKLVYANVKLMCANVKLMCANVKLMCQTYETKTGSDYAKNSRRCWDVCAIVCV